MKRCHTCNKQKALHDFHKLKSGGQGHHPRCKACRSIYFQENKKTIMRKQKVHRASGSPCVYRIKHKTTGEYFLGATTMLLHNSITSHFGTLTYPGSPFSGKNRDNYDITTLCYGTEEQVQKITKHLLSTRVKKDNKCLNRSIR
jgi:hypothetical protein